MGGFGGGGGRNSGSQDNDVSGNEAVFSGGQTYSSRQTKSRSKSKSKSKTTTSSSGGGGGQDSNYNQYTAYTSEQIASGKAKVAEDIAKDNKTAFDNMKYEGSDAPSLLAQGLDFIGVSEKAFDVNKAYYEKNVIGKNNFTASPDDFKRYMAARGTGKVDAMGRTISGGNDNDNTINKQGIELAKASTTSATISGPGEIQKEAANTIKGPTTTEMSAAQINVANKRKGRKSTNITAKKILNENYTLSKKSLLG